ncbi:hypothetical protein BHE18_15710 [Rossellomorea aquimaris]|uniref:Uncharacterized protein n=1 Tax=Rossellomorea aquimaris TaxID=189382 RepID=A0A1J6X061_9BACI|nr:hypothetical protein BHE18_15710 [Rossellomorea aquimaris]
MKNRRFLKIIHMTVKNQTFSSVSNRPRASWSVLKNRRYLGGFVILFLGVGIHFWGLYVVGRWEGLSISLFFGGGAVLIGLLTIILIFPYSKMSADN